MYVKIWKKYMTPNYLLKFTIILLKWKSGKILKMFRENNSIVNIIEQLVCLKIKKYMQK